VPKMDFGEFEGVATGAGLSDAPGTRTVRYSNDVIVRFGKGAIEDELTAPGFEVAALLDGVD
jgi:hypothetical protein